jgi:hypothetical protein
MSQDQQDALSIFSASEDYANTKALADKTSEEQQGSFISVPGTYRVKVKSMMSSKENKKTWPSFSISDRDSTKGDFVLNLLFECVDGTEAVAVGDTIFSNIIVAKDAGADQKKKWNTIKYAKPILHVLLGKKKTVSYENAFLAANFTAGFDDSGKVIRDHMMKDEIMIVVEENYSETTKKRYCNIKNYRMPNDNAETKEHSISIRSHTAVTDGAISEIANSKGNLKRSEGLNMGSEDFEVPPETPPTEDA